MARRRRRKATPRSAPNIPLIILQIAVLIGALIAVIGLRDGIGSGTSAMVESLTSEDLAIEAQSDEETPALPADQTVDGVINDSENPSENHP